MRTHTRTCARTLAHTTGASQLFAYDNTTRYIVHAASGNCLTFGGGQETDLAPTFCANWTAPVLSLA